ncbi:MAG: S8 family serine peptidase [Gammaproteobacteria bacterium]|nr:S8 family serine peptidase [Gammaproteobacteria bacterium]
MSIRAKIVTSCLLAYGVLCHAGPDDAVVHQGIFKNQSALHDSPVGLLPRSDWITLDHGSELTLKGLTDVSISRSNSYIRFSADTPRGQQNIFLDANDTRTRLAFDRSVRELRLLENTFRVVLSEYTDFDGFLKSADTHGRAFPALARAYVDIPLAHSHESFYEVLRIHPKVHAVDLVFARPSEKKADRIAHSFQRTFIDENAPSSYKKALSTASSTTQARHYDFKADLRIDELSPKDVSGSVFITNEGTEPYRFADGGSYEVRLGRLHDNFIDLDSYEIADFEGEQLFEIPPGTTIFRTFFRLRPDDWESNQMYVLVVDITTNDGSETFGHKLFATNQEGEPIVTCPLPNRIQDLDTVGDPFYEFQWALKNTGQSAFGVQGGIEGEDVRMQATQELDLGGRNVNVAVVDTGLDICHPDLQSNIAQSQSINFRHRDWRPAVPWPSVRSSDPYNPILVGDHGTAMAGVIGAVSDNGIGIRGVAPFVWIRAFNYLSDPTTANFLTALGSGETRHTSDVDIFNLSLGDQGTFFVRSLADIEEENAPFAHGTSFLRNEKGAVYVKASGNEFNSCTNAVNQRIGCVSSQTDRINSSPYVITVGGLNAAGLRAAYSNTGSNVWLTAPGGSRDSSPEGYPGLISLDQFGTDRGHLWTQSPDHWSRNHDLNPRGSVLAPGGTSLSNAIVTGAIAILLEVEPNLTWRDIKHILAVSSRQVDPDIETVPFSHANLQEDVVVQHAWQTNEAGYEFHNYYGFGALDIDAAVEMVQGYEPESLPARVMSDWVTLDDQSDFAIPDGHAEGVVASITLDTDELPQDTTIESVELVVSLTHPWAADVQIELTSPSGTISIVSPAFNVELRRYVQSGMLYLGSNAFYGENASGTWNIRFRDVFADDVGSIHTAYMRIHGASNSISPES